MFFKSTNTSRWVKFCSKNDATSAEERRVSFAYVECCVRDGASCRRNGQTQSTVNCVLCRRFTVAHFLDLPPSYCPPFSPLKTWREIALSLARHARSVSFSSRRVLRKPHAFVRKRALCYLSAASYTGTPRFRVFARPGLCGCVCLCMFYRI